MSLPDVVSRDDWTAARKRLLEREKQLTRQRDELNADRRRLPMVRVDTEYVFTGPEGPLTLLDLFDGCRQLIVQHFMYGPDWESACPSCTASVDEMSDGLLQHLRVRDTAYAYVSRAPIEKIEAWRKQHGWAVRWVSSYGSDFNYDYHVTLDESVAPMEYNYRTRAEHQAAGTAGYFEGDQPLERPGMSMFLRDCDDVYHTYSTFARGCEAPGGSYYLLDLTALGRQEEWEEPKGRADRERVSVPDFAS